MNTSKKVGLWIRVSTDSQVKDESPEHHERRGKMYAETKGWEVVEVYRLDALSGKSVIEYAETKRMLRDIQEGKITGLIFSKLARLARNTKELLEFAEVFRACNADLISLAESIDTSTPAGRLFYTMVAGMAQWEREEIAERVAASVPIRARMGKPLGGHAPLGYKWENKEFLVDEKEAPVRKLMYEIFLKTKRKKTTANELNKLGYRTRNGAKFTDSTVFRLLKDPTAKGMRLANYTKTRGKGKHWEFKPESEWIQLPCPAIISDELWEECNRVIREQELKQNAKGPRAVHLLSGYVHCTCGNKMYVYAPSPAYKCRQCRKKIDAVDLDEIYHEQLRSFLLADTDLATMEAKSQNVIAEKEELLKSVSTEHTKLKRKIEELLNLRLNGELSKQDFASFYQPLEEQARQLEKQLPEIEAEIDFLKIDLLSSGTVHQEAKDLYSRWTTLPFEEKRSIIEIITERIIVDTDTIDITLAYLPAPHSSQNVGNRQHAH